MRWLQVKMEGSKEPFLTLDKLERMLPKQNIAYSAEWKVACKNGISKKDILESFTPGLWLRTPRPMILENMLASLFVCGERRGKRIMLHSLEKKCPLNVRPSELGKFEIFSPEKIQRLSFTQEFIRKEVVAFFSRSVYELLDGCARMEHWKAPEEFEISVSQCKKQERNTVWSYSCIARDDFNTESFPRVSAKLEIVEASEFFEIESIGGNAATFSISVENPWDSNDWLRALQCTLFEKDSHLLLPRFAAYIVEKTKYGSHLRAMLRRVVGQSKNSLHT